MRVKLLAILMAVLMVFAAGCGKKKDEPEKITVPSVSEKHVSVSESDVKAVYTVPTFKNIDDQAVQDEINAEIAAVTEMSAVKVRRVKAEQLLSQSDIAEHSFSEYGTYKIYYNDGKYLSFYLSVEQRFTKDEETKSVRQNYVFNYDMETGRRMDVSELFIDRDSVCGYMAGKLYERLLGMGCLESDVYSESVFEDDIEDYCAIVSQNKIAVVTTAGKFGLKTSAGAPCVEISIPEDYYLKSE